MGTLAVLFVSFWIASSAFGLEPAPVKQSVAAAPDPKSVAIPSATDKKIEDLDAQIKKNPKDAKAEIQLAHAYYDKREFAKSTPLLWKNIDKLEKPDFYILIRAHNELAQGEDLLRISNLLVSKNSKDFEALHYQGKAFVLQKKDKEAIESFRKALEINPKYLPSYLSLADIYEKRKNLYELRNLYQDMLTTFGPRAEILTNLCRVNTKDGLNDVAENFCRQAMQKDPDIPDNYVNLALVTIHTGDRVKGKELLAKAAEKFPKSDLAQFQYANFLEEDKNFLDSYKYYKVCVNILANSERCLVGYANSALQIQKLEEAHDTFKALCKINRSYAVNVRRALATLRTTGPQEWARKFDALSEYCAL